jgi:hypothetical protein
MAGGAGFGLGGASGSIARHRRIGGLGGSCGKAQDQQGGGNPHVFSKLPKYRLDNFSIVHWALSPEARRAVQ